MSVVIVGGNECMVRQYKDLCKEYSCDAKVFVKMKGSFKNMIGNPDLLILFTSTMSHKMARTALSETKDLGMRIARSHSSSKSALECILKEHTGLERDKMQQ